MSTILAPENRSQPLFTISTTYAHIMRKKINYNSLRNYPRMDESALRSNKAERSKDMTQEYWAHSSQVTIIGTNIVLSPSQANQTMGSRGWRPTHGESTAHLGLRQQALLLVCSEKARLLVRHGCGQRRTTGKFSFLSTS